MTDWRIEYLEMKGRKQLSKRQVDLLENGPDSLASSWLLMAMKYDYQKITGNLTNE